MKRFTTFSLIFAISTISSIGNRVSVGEDIAEQVRSSSQWYDGKVVAPNFISTPDKTDLSMDKQIWSIRPPGAAILPLLGLLSGFTLGHSIQLGLILCSLIGGYGWLFLFIKFKVDKYLILILSIMLGFSAGNFISSYTSANIILFALVPWFILLHMIITNRFYKYGLTRLNILLLCTFLFLLGCFAWIKLSGLIVSGTIGACLFFTLLRETTRSRIIIFLFIYGIIGIFFWIPYLFLEKINLSLTAVTADQFYGGNDSDLQAPLFGNFWGNSTKGIWLLWSIISAPGYSLPIKDFAHGTRDLGMQFESLIQFLHQMSINEHVLFCGIISIGFSIMLIREAKGAWSKLESVHQITLASFLIFPFIGLGILSYRYEWNYLMFHAHTAEFWLLYTIPTLTILSTVEKVKLSSYALFVVILALPLCNAIQVKAIHLYGNEKLYISDTERDFGLSNSRFSEAIDFIEKDTKSDLDIVYFLPIGDTGDLVLRTKLRSMATHFAGYNFPKVSPANSSKNLNIYLTYDSTLEKNSLFIAAKSKVFPNSISRKTISKGDITIHKIELLPQI